MVLPCRTTSAWTSPVEPSSMSPVTTNATDSSPVPEAFSSATLVTFCSSPCDVPEKPPAQFSTASVTDFIVCSAPSPS
jgi:hypothetical protein